jgi:uncharacterized repeat protein (TIGR03803 family)
VATQLVEQNRNTCTGGKLQHRAIITFCLLAFHAAAQQTSPPPGTINTLHRFTINTPDGDTPQAGLLLGDDLNLYGTTSSGGDKTCRCGTIFQITTDGALTTLFTFSTATGAPTSPLVKDSHGNLWGTSANNNGVNMVFRFTPGGGFATFKLAGSRPNALVLASDGNLYGTTAGSNAAPDYGTFYRITPDGIVTLLHKFDLPSEGISSPTAVAEGPDHNFYGVIIGTD